MPWCLVLLCWEKLLVVAADGAAARMGRDKVLGTCAVRYCALLHTAKEKTGTGAREATGESEERRRRASGGGGGVCGERQRQRQREKRDRKNEQGTGTLADATGAGHGRARQTFWGRKETENSAVGCALSRTVLEPSSYGAWWRGGRGGGGGGLQDQGWFLRCDAS